MFELEGAEKGDSSAPPLSYEERAAAFMADESTLLLAEQQQHEEEEEAARRRRAAPDPASRTGDGWDPFCVPTSHSKGPSSSLQVVLASYTCGFYGNHLYCCEF